MVIIKGFKMPESCSDCDLCYDAMECCVSYGPAFWSGRSENDEFDFCKERHPRCPLKELAFDFQPVVLKFNNSISKQDLIGALEKTTIAGILPPVQPEQKRKTGYWIVTDIPDLTTTAQDVVTFTRQCRCSECGALFGRKSDNYCYNCGAEMDGDTE